MIAVIDSRMPFEAQQVLQNSGHTLCPLPPHPLLDVPVSGHPDMLLFFSESEIYCTETYIKIAENEVNTLSRLAKRKIVCIKENVKKQYPNDILLNAACVGKHLFCLSSHTAKELLCAEQYTVCNVKQGYAKCSTLPVTSNALITEDPSIARCAKSLGLDVLQVSTNAVTLSGYSTGFLGGASSYAPYECCDTILFCGNLDLHPDAKSIRNFCTKHQKKTLSLGAFPLTDVGTIFLI